MYARKGKLWKWTGIFFAGMLLFTILSRAVYQNSVIVVTTAAPSNGTIAHQVTVSGKTVQNQELAVTTVGGLRIAGVYVNEGQQVKQGDVLFALDLEFLKETILYQEQEMQKQKLSIQDAKSQSSASAEQRSNAQARAEENYRLAVSKAEAVLEQARQELLQAEEALAAFRQQQEVLQPEDAPTETVPQTIPEPTTAPVLQIPEQTEAELEAAVAEAQRKFDQAWQELEDTKTIYGWEISAASISSGTSHAAQIGQISHDQMAYALEKLKTLEAAEGKILSPADGVVTSISVRTGEKTTDSAAVLLADLSQGCKFTGLVSEEQSQYIGVGDKVSIQAGSNGKVYQDLPVTTFSATEEAGGHRIAVQLPLGSLSLGADAELEFAKKSQPYSICVPLSALHLDERNQAYVLVLEEVNTILGTQTQAKKVAVTVLDQNETMAALEEGSLGMMQQIIVGSSQAVEPGSRVRAE